MKIYSEGWARSMHHKSHHGVWQSDSLFNICIYFITTVILIRFFFSFINLFIKILFRLIIIYSEELKMILIIIN